jgi:hypothetical protein
LKAEFFAIGPIGASASISPAERALLRIPHEPAATKMLLDLLPHATLPGQLYALLGLRQCGYESITELLEDYRKRAEEVATQSACLRGLQSIRSIIERIQDGTYSSLLETHDKG